jgi:hypothetical protein
MNGIITGNIASCSEQFKSILEKHLKLEQFITVNKYMQSIGFNCDFKAVPAIAQNVNNTYNNRYDRITITKNTKLSDLLETVSNNYSSYYECKTKHDSWIEWYNDNKKIYESVK